MFSVMKNIYRYFFINTKILCSIISDSIDANNNHELQKDGVLDNRIAMEGVELEYLKLNLSTLSPKELDVLNDVVDNHLIRKEDDHYLLLAELSKSIEVFKELRIINIELNNTPNKYDIIDINNKILSELKINRRRVYAKVYNLHCYSVKYFISLRKLIKKADLSRNKIKFYLFILGLTRKTLEYIYVAPMRCPVKSHYLYLLRFYHLYEKYIRLIINNIKLPTILYHTEKCILEEADIDELSLMRILARLRPLRRNIIRYYNGAEQSFLFLRNIENIVKENKSKR
ncbi:uncharacterized protein VNE69_02090 [Vairimorpha necatrix]|uniref:Uncharacterized protein n=1 Tax=Vairimorpha necatrix TaxID=6039 RepID=A0AAX4J9L7_9MICR